MRTPHEWRDLWQGACISTVEIIEQVQIEAWNEAIEAAQRWISVEEELPFVYETGNWDGKRSDMVLAKSKDETYFLAKLYSGFLDNSEFNDWYDKDDYMIKVTHWRPITINLLK